jgi:predicted subunit of tRNA(5-methylaminomethyl-2-thiouridylate) methyltransferase
MIVYIVTSTAQEKDSGWTILSVKVRTFGVFTSSSHANALAEKHGATVKELVLDREVNGDIIQSWLNPGYAD